MMLKTFLPAVMPVVMIGWLALQLPAGAAEALTAVGKIVDVAPQGVADVIRTDGSREDAEYGALLFAGDRFEFHGRGVVQANIHGKEKAFRSGDANLTISGRDLGFWGAADEKVMEIYAFFIKTPRQSIPVYATVRGGEAGDVTLAPSPLAPVGRQYVARDTDHLALLWRGGAARIHVKPDGAPEAVVDSGRNAWAVVSLAGKANRTRISTERQTIEWTIERSDAVPVPEWFEGKPPASEAQRLVRAIWLLRQDDTSWRLFALTELSDLAAAGNFNAIELWTGIRSGELDGFEAH